MTLPTRPLRFIAGARHSPPLNKKRDVTSCLPFKITRNVPGFALGLSLMTDSIGKVEKTCLGALAWRRVSAV